MPWETRIAYGGIWLKCSLSHFSTISKHTEMVWHCVRFCHCRSSMIMVGFKWKKGFFNFISSVNVNVCICFEWHMLIWICQIFPGAFVPWNECFYVLTSKRVWGVRKKAAEKTKVMLPFKRNCSSNKFHRWKNMVSKTLIFPPRARAPQTQAPHSTIFPILVDIISYFM